MSALSKKIFYYDDDDTKPIHACGLVLYKFIDDKLELLLIDKNKFEDIGGKVENIDNNIYDTVMREVEEETNGIIKGNDIKKRLLKAYNVYIPHAKYIIYFIKANSDEEKLNEKDFGNIENKDKIKRKILWIPFSILNKKNIMKYKISERIKSMKFFDKLNIIQKTGKKVKKLF
jgi:hypothetical protein